MQLVAWLQALQVVVTVVGFAFAIWQLRSGYRWRSRQFALQMLAGWNGKTDPHRRGVEQGLPGLLDATREVLTTTLTAERAESIHSARRVEKRVADRQILAESLCPTVPRLYRQIEPYVLITNTRRGFDAWKPLTDSVRELEHAAVRAGGIAPQG